METILFLFSSQLNFAKYGNLARSVNDYGHKVESKVEENLVVEEIEESKYLLIFTDAIPQELNNSKFRLLKNLTADDIINDINVQLCEVN